MIRTKRSDKTRAATLLALLGVIASCRSHRFGHHHPRPQPQAPAEERLFVRELTPPSQRQRVLDAVFRERLGFALSRVCPFNPPGTSYLRSITVPAGRRRALELELEREHLQALPDSLARGSQDPDDPEFPAQWGLRNPGGVETGAVTSVEGIDIGAPCAWQYLQDHPPTSTLPLYALVIDGGVAEITELQTAFAPLSGPPGGGPHGVDFIGHDLEPLIHALDPDAGISENTLALSHGTMSAGIIAAQANNTLGIAGAVGPERTPPFRLVSARVLRVNTQNKLVGTGADTVCALRYGAVLAAWLREGHRGRLVAVNLSLTDPNASEHLRTLYTEAFAALEAEQVLVLAATGNTDPDDLTRCDGGPQFPSTSAAPNVLAVGGANSAGGPVYCRGAAQVPVAAPAFVIRAPTAIPSGVSATHHCGGTSCAAPLATAVALLVAASRPSLGAVALKELLISTALPVPALSGAVSAGLVNACRALNSPQRPQIVIPVGPPEGWRPPVEHIPTDFRPPIPPIPPRNPEPPAPPIRP